MAKFRKLRGAFRELDIDYEYLSKKLGISSNSISRRMTDKPNCGWTLEEAYRVLEIINKPASQIGEYFPPRGIA